jgi:hypothetical protein
MFRILGYAFLFFIAQILLLILWVWLAIALDIKETPFDIVILYLYLWPLMILGTPSGSHGGELFFAPVAAIIYALIFGFLMNAWRNSQS